jgi:hypothetical protein
MKTITHVCMTASFHGPPFEIQLRGAMFDPIIRFNQLQRLVPVQNQDRDFYRHMSCSLENNYTCMHDSIISRKGEDLIHI